MIAGLTHDAEALLQKSGDQRERALSRSLLKPQMLAMKNRMEDALQKLRALKTRTPTAAPPAAAVYKQTASELQTLCLEFSYLTKMDRGIGRSVHWRPPLGVSRDCSLKLQPLLHYGDECRRAHRRTTTSSSSSKRRSARGLADARKMRKHSASQNNSVMRVPRRARAKRISRSARAQSSRLDHSGAETRITDIPIYEPNPGGHGGAGSSKPLEGHVSLDARTANASKNGRTLHCECAAIP